MAVFKKGRNWYIDYYLKGKRKRRKIGPAKQIADLAEKNLQLKLRSLGFSRSVAARLASRLTPSQLSVVLSADQGEPGPGATPPQKPTGVADDRREAEDAAELCRALHSYLKGD